MGNNYSGKNNRVKWRIIETRVQDNAAVQVSELPLKIPRYSFKVGTAQLDEETGDMRIGPRLTSFNFEDAIELLQLLGQKYQDKREQRIEEVEAKKAEWQQSNSRD